MFTSVLMIEKALTSADVEFVTTLHGEEDVSFHVLLQPRGDQADRLLRAIDDVAMGEFDEAGRESEVPEGDEAKGPAEKALAVSSPRCTRRAARRWAGSSRTTRWTPSRRSSTR